MPRLPQVTTDDATDEQRDLLDATQRQLGRVPNLYRTMANSPAALRGYLAFRSALTDGVLKPALREQLALLVAELNSCPYCVAAHGLRGAKMGMSDGELLGVRSARHADPHTHAALQFARAVVAKAGDITDETVAAARAAVCGWPPTPGPTQARSSSHLSSPTRRSFSGRRVATHRPA
ncbi:carboxymuconolactone decarboxylase family protein [Allorhizocola rhizosphaerae]|uniref:carboxymuconolactone decarboxylase family protein n=1 Tax=Allorhizocola rhizosphaerae TaxID=1872709 RepID=UPI000E3C3B06|nr:carboxymuconolactone decarboxylase family protein [Allorhizocola rhizosphaerae]